MLRAAAERNQASWPFYPFLSWSPVGNWRLLPPDASSELFLGGCYLIHIYLFGTVGVVLGCVCVCVRMGVI